MKDKYFYNNSTTSGVQMAGELQLWVGQWSYRDFYVRGNWKQVASFLAIKSKIII